DAVVRVVGDVDFAIGPRRDPSGIAELPVAAAKRAPLGQVGARFIELLDAVVEAVRDIDVAGGVCPHAIGLPELPIAAAERAPLGQVGARFCELLDANVSKFAGIEDEDTTSGSRDTMGFVELPVS